MAQQNDLPAMYDDPKMAFSQRGGAPETTCYPRQPAAVKITRSAAAATR